MRDIVLDKQRFGRVRAYEVQPSGLWVPRTDWRANSITYGWGAIVARLLATGDSAYKIAAMYLEFANGTPPITAPGVDRTWSADYYRNLADNDYLSVPIRAAQITSSGDEYPDGNSVIFTAKSGGDNLVGLAHGLDFGSSYNSVVIGAALVAQPDPADSSQDMVLSTYYFAPANQQTKLASSEIGIDWEFSLR